MRVGVGFGFGVGVGMAMRSAKALFLKESGASSMIADWIETNFSDSRFAKTKREISVIRIIGMTIWSILWVRIFS